VFFNLSSSIKKKKKHVPKINVYRYHGVGTRNPFRFDLLTAASLTGLQNDYCFVRMMTSPLYTHAHTCTREIILFRFPVTNIRRVHSHTCEYTHNATLNRARVCRSYVYLNAFKQYGVVNTIWTLPSCYRCGNEGGGGGEGHEVEFEF